ncbi:MAG: PQQ-like beta-propeller repeat protein [Planctomycetes bacterium]|nr:PQQ-like beta-propeller repeat protein [Planctomycetota bacterium]
MMVRSPGLVATSVALALLAPAAASAQEAPANQLHYPLAEELAGMLRAADGARAAGKLEEAIDLYRLVLDTDRQGRAGYQLATVQEVARPVALGAAPTRRYVGVTEWAMNGLRALPPEGLKLFRARYDYRAGSALTEARAAKDPFHALARVYELYPVSSHAPKMLEQMADLALERAELERALLTLERLLAHHAAELADPPRVRRKLLLCALALGRVERVRELARELERDDPKGRVHLGARPLTTDELVARAVEAQSRRAGRGDEGRPRLDLVRIDPANRASTDARPQVGAPAFVRTFEGERERSLGGARPFTPGQVAQTPSRARHQPLVRDGRVFIPTADQVLAYDLADGEEGPRIPRVGPSFVDENERIQFGGAIEQETLVVPLVDEVLRDQQYRGIPIKVKIPLRKLAGFDLAGWRWAWNHAQSLDGTPLERWSFPAPPTAVEGVVFAPAFSIEGFVNSHVAAFDARTGERLWDTWVVSGQVEQTMFGEQATEPLCTPLAVSDGVVYHSTSFGCVAALDAITGRLLWVTEYEQLEVRPPRGYYADRRQISWESNAPLVEGGVVVAAPLDSPRYLGLDARTGERLWDARQRSSAAAGEMRYLMGACAVGEPGARQGAVVVAGGGEVRCLSVRTGKLLWYAQLRGRVVAGRGCIAQGVALVPVDRNEVLLFEVETGKRLGNITVGTTGNVVLVGGHALVTGNGAVAVHRLGAGAPPPAPPRGQDF